MPRPRHSRGHPDALDLRGPPGHHGQLGLEHDLAVDEPGVRPAGADQVVRPAGGSCGRRPRPAVRRRPPRCTWPPPPGRAGRPRRRGPGAPPGRPARRAACRWPAAAGWGGRRGPGPSAGEPVPEAEHGVGAADDGRAEPLLPARAGRRRRPPPASVASTGVRLPPSQQSDSRLRRAPYPRIRPSARHQASPRAAIRSATCAPANGSWSSSRSTARRSDSPSWRTGTVSTTTSLPDRPRGPPAEWRARRQTVSGSVTGLAGRVGRPPDDRETRARSRRNSRQRERSGTPQRGRGWSPRRARASCGTRNHAVRRLILRLGVGRVPARRRSESGGGMPQLPDHVRERPAAEQDDGARCGKRAAGGEQNAGQGDDDPARPGRAGGSRQGDGAACRAYPTT